MDDDKKKLSAQTFTHKQLQRKEKHILPQVSRKKKSIKFKIKEKQKENK